MDLNVYQEKARATAIYPNRGSNILYPTLGLCGESGEVAEKVKKILRDEGGVVTESKKEQIAAEIGDILWYVSQLAAEIGFTLSEVAELNLSKLASRAERGVLTGNGDNR